MRLVDADKLRYKHSLNTVNTTMPQSFPCITKDEINTAPTVEAIPKDQYEARLKADMVAMLTELQVGIDEHINPSNHTDSYEDGWSEGAEWCIDYIQEKIKSLKENKDEAHD